MPNKTRKIEGISILAIAVLSFCLIPVNIPLKIDVLTTGITMPIWFILQHLYLWQGSASLQPLMATATRMPKPY